MKGFLEWFKGKAKMKRWMLLILVGIVLACLGIAELMVAKELSFFEVGKVILSFVIGFTCIILGLVFSQKRVLEVLIENTDERLSENRKTANVNNLIFNKKVYHQGPNVVVIGGGSGLNTVLQGLKGYTDNITAIVTISDYGKLPTSSRKQLEMLPLDDIKDSIVSLANDEESMRNLFDYEFQEGRLKSLSFGDIYMLAMKDVNKDFSSSVEKSSNILNMTGKVLPVTLDEVKICAELKDGTIVEEKDKIPEMVYNKITKINRIFITPSNCKPAPGVIEAIQKADAIVIGPGSLYTNVIPNLLVPGVAKAIKENKGLKIYVSNIMTEPGQTDSYTVTDHINAILEHSGSGVINYCIYDTGEVVPEFIKKYNQEGAELVEQDVKKLEEKGIYLLQRNLSYISEDGYIRHNPNAVAAAVIELICDDLRFKDQKSDPQYVMLNSKLKDEKRLNKLAKKTAPKKRTKKKEEKKDRTKKNSKFYSKYSERIESIQTSDHKREENKNKAEGAKILKQKLEEKEKNKAKK